MLNLHPDIDVACFAEADNEQETALLATAFAKVNDPFAACCVVRVGGRPATTTALLLLRTMMIRASSTVSAMRVVHEGSHSCVLLASV